MKMVYYKYKNHKKDKGRMKTKGFEKIIYIAVVVTFVVLVIVQAAMANPSVRTYLTVDGDYDGTALETEKYMYNNGKIGLVLLQGETDGSVKVLVNGNPIAVFSGKELSIDVKEGDVVEIDTSECDNPAQVSVATNSGSISSKCIGKMVEAFHEVKKLVRVEAE
jgi:hypothetical protein